MADRTWGFATRAIHAGSRPDPVTGARAVPIYESSGFVFEDTADAANLFALQKYGTVYSRISNPTVATFEERMASLEGGLGAVATSTGQAASFLVFAALAGTGDHIVAGSALYGGTVNQLGVSLKRFGVETSYVSTGEPADFAAAITDRTKLIFVELLSNPACEVADLEGLAKVAHEAGIPLVVDATTATPYLCRPIEHGADIVVHSATKFIGGHGTTLGGVVVDAGTFDWGNGNFPVMTEPAESYNGIRWWDNFSEYGFLTKLRSEQLRDIGASLSATSAFNLLIGLETLPQRMRNHVENAGRVARWLADDDRVAWVKYAGLPDHPQADLVAKYFPDGAGSVFSFGVVGGREAGQTFIESVELCSHLANIGDAKTLVIHPASTTHQQLTDEQLTAGGVSPDLVRISVGIEDVDDILWDLDQALTAATKDLV